MMYRSCKPIFTNGSGITTQQCRSHYRANNLNFEYREQFFTGNEEGVGLRSRALAYTLVNPRAWCSNMRTHTSQSMIDSDRIPSAQDDYRISNWSG